MKRIKSRVTEKIGPTEILNIDAILLEGKKISAAILLNQSIKPKTTALIHFEGRDKVGILLPKGKDICCCYCKVLSNQTPR